MLFGHHHDVSPHDACLSALQDYHDAMTHFGTQLGGYVDGTHGVTAGDVAHAGVVAYGAGHTADAACDPGLAGE